MSTANVIALRTIDASRETAKVPGRMRVGSQEQRPSDGPAEAGDLVASHFAILIDGRPDHSYLKTAYSSEPILATVASDHIAHIGWHAPLMALCHYIDSAVVSSGFSGELLTKVICLMTMDIRSVDTNLPPSPRRAQSSPDTKRPSTRRSSCRARHTRLLKAPPASGSEFRATTPVPPSFWRYTQPLKVIQFLDHLLAAPRDYGSFSSALIEK